MNIARTLIYGIAFASSAHAFAQPQLDAELNTLPVWMQQMISKEKPQPYVLPKRAPLHTNAFIGTWSIAKKNGSRYDFWSDKYRVVIKEIDRKGEQRRTYYIDLEANLRMNASTHEDGNFFAVEDLEIPQAGYFRELWNDSVQATGRVEDILGASCKELRGIDGNKDSTYYWSTNKHPKLFADLLVWAQWLCREGDLKFLSALSDRNAGGSMRVDWPKRRFGPEAGSIAFLSITPGATPMPVLEHRPYKVVEQRFQWLNNSGIGRLPDWMRSSITSLEPHPLPVQFTPAPVDRGIADNAFIGTFTAETPTRYVDERKDTTIRLAKYSYWADARRAVLTLNDPDDEGTVIYMVDLDADVAIVATNEGHSYVIPKLYIGTLEDAGLTEFGRGVEMDFQPQGQYKTILGRICELHTSAERFLHFYLFPKEEVQNPIFDMARWMEPRPSQKFKDIMFFGVADRPMPMAVMSTQLTSYKPGSTKPPIIDLSNYSVRDQRLERRRNREERPMIEERIISMDDLENDNLVAPTEEPPVYMIAEPRIEIPEPPPVAPPPPPVAPR